MIADEPTANLDTHAVPRIHGPSSKASPARVGSILSHQPRSAGHRIRRLVDRVVEMRDGRIVTRLTP
jgi:ABC-type transport system involved in cytochrome bd biosynthesis fused ATPase/permease subunit